jgi:hypothetical protein
MIQLLLGKYYELKSNTSDANFCVGEWVMGVKYGLTYCNCYKTLYIPKDSLRPYAFLLWGIYKERLNAF